LRLIIPLTDNWHYPVGGKHNFTDWRGISDENQFYYNPQVIGDFETYISTQLNRVNSYTGVSYKNDPTILAWETVMS
jgi:mannan endo-1,4-beta-mannosidase